MRFDLRSRLGPDTVEAQDGTAIPTWLARYLADNEEIVTAQRPHPAMLFVPVVVLFGGLIVVVPAAQKASPGGADVLWRIWALLFVWVTWRLWLWSRQWLVVTTRRIVQVEQFPWKARMSQVMIILGRDITVERPVPGELFGFGTFIFESQRDGHPMRRIPYVARPDDLARVIAETLNGPLPAASPGPGTQPGRRAAAGSRGAPAAQAPPGVMTGIVIGGENEGGVVLVEPTGAEQRTTHHTEPIPPTAPLRAAAPAPSTGTPGAQNRWLQRVSGQWSGQSKNPRNPGIISSNPPESYAPGEQQDPSTPAGRPIGLLGRVQGLGLFRRRG